MILKRLKNYYSLAFAHFYSLANFTKRLGFLSTPSWERNDLLRLLTMYKDIGTLILFLKWRYCVHSHAWIANCTPATLANSQLDWPPPSWYCHCRQNACIAVTQNEAQACIKWANTESTWPCATVIMVLVFRISFETHSLLDERAWARLTLCHHVRCLWLYY